MSDMKHKSQLQWIFKSTLIVSNSSIIVTTKRKDKLMSDLNSNPCMQMIDYMRTFIFLQKILALFIAQDGICTGNVAAYSVTFTCVQLQGLSYYCIQSQPCNENNCFMAFFFFWHLSALYQYVFATTARLLFPFYVCIELFCSPSSSIYSSLLQLLLSEVPAPIKK